MSRECVLKTFVSLGISEAEAEVYLFLTQAGTVKAIDISKTLRLNKQQVYRSLKNLQTRGMVKANHKPTSQYTAVSLEKVLDQFMKEKKIQAKALQASRKELLSSWHSMVETDSTNS